MIFLTSLLGSFIIISQVDTKSTKPTKAPSKTSTEKKTKTEKKSATENKSSIESSKKKAPIQTSKGELKEIDWNPLQNEAFDLKSVERLYDGGSVPDLKTLVSTKNWIEVVTTVWTPHGDGAEYHPNGILHEAKIKREGYFRVYQFTATPTKGLNDQGEIVDGLLSNPKWKILRIYFARKAVSKVGDHGELETEYLKQWIRSRTSSMTPSEFLQSDSEWGFDQKVYNSSRDILGLEEIRVRQATFNNQPCLVVKVQLREDDFNRLEDELATATEQLEKFKLANPEPSSDNSEKYLSWYKQYSPLYYRKENLLEFLNAYATPTYRVFVPQPWN